MSDPKMQAQGTIFPINELPPELIYAICEHVAALSPKTLVSLCQTSKKIHELGNKLVFRNVSLMSRFGPRSQLFGFASAVVGSQRLVHAIELQFTPGHLSAFMTGMRSAVHNMAPLLNTFPTLQHLTTFILYQPWVELRERRGVIPNDQIGALIQALPCSVVDLEIDTGGADRLGSDSSQAMLHLINKCSCLALSGIIPRLHNLRLRKSCLCSKAFERFRASHSSNLGRRYPLRTLTIRLDMDTQETLHYTTTAICDNDPHKDTAAAGFTTYLREGIEAGMFPSLKHAIMVSRLGNDEPSRLGREEHFATARKTKHGGFVVQDAVRNCSLLVPVVAVQCLLEYSKLDLKGSDRPSEYDAPSPWEKDRLSACEDRYLVRDFDGNDLFTDYSNLAKVLEGQQDFRNLASQRCTQPYRLDLSVLEQQTLPALSKKVQMSIWDREKATKQCLLRAIEVPGLKSLPQMIDEILPNGWTYGKQTELGESSILTEREWDAINNSYDYPIGPENKIPENWDWVSTD